MDIEIDFDYLFYMYCIKMRRSSDEFWHSSFSQVAMMIDMYTDELLMKASATDNNEYQSKYFNLSNEVRTITSMNEIEGW